MSNEQKQEIEKIKRKQRSRGPQLCWTCKKAVCKCSWSKNLEPVKGWDAYEVPFYLGGTTYHIVSCPEYVEDDNE